MIIKGKYKTGIYVGEKMEEKGDRTLMKVLAVLKHPLQGDLHQGFDTDVPLFHERKALAQFEKTWIPTVTVTSFDNEVPNYNESLKQALADEMNKMKKREDPFGDKALTALKTLEQHYPI